MKFDLHLPKLEPSHRTYLMASLAYLAIALVMFWNVTANFGSAVPGSEDAYQSLWNLWWSHYSLFSLHQSIYATKLLFYPLGANLASQTLMPLAGLFTWPLQWNMAVAFNTLFFLSFVLSGIFTFILAEQVTGNRYAAFIAGLIFAFSPVHIAHAVSQLDWATVEFIPLFALAMLGMVRTKRKSYAALAAVSFLLLTFIGDIEQGIMMVTFAILSFAVLLFFQRKDLLNRKTYVNLGIFAALVILLGSPLFIQLIPKLNSGALSSASQLSDVAHNMLYSDNIAGYLLPSYYNLLFHSASESYYNQTYGLSYGGAEYNPNPTEKTAYIGYSVLFLALFAIYVETKRKRFDETGYWIVMGIIFFLLSLGPFVQLTGQAVTPLPSLGLVYRTIPLFNLIREPGRFDFVVELCVAVLAAIGFSRLSNQKKNPFLYAVIFSIIILIEYNGMPAGAFGKSMLSSTQIPNAYYELSKVPGNFSILTLPALPGPTGSFYYPGLEMYYQTASHKPMIGGYTSRVNSTQELSMENVPLIDSAAYLEYGENFVYPYPIMENYSNLTMLWLAEYNVGYVGVIRKAYNISEQEQIMSYLVDTFGNESYQNANLTVFSVGRTLSAKAGRSIVSYTIGNWYPGYDACGQSIGCNQTLASLWWGPSVRGIMVYSPNQTSADVRIKALSLGGPEKVYVYEGQNPVTALNLTSVDKNYTFNVTLVQGFNPIAFYGQNSTASEYGMDNITISRG